MIEITESEARTIIRTLIALADEGWDWLPEEEAIYNKLNGFLEIETAKEIMGIPTSDNSVRNLPQPPPSRFEEDEYEPNVQD